MKRIIAILLTAMLVIISLTGCGDNYIDSTNIAKLSKDDADATLSAWLTKLDVTHNDPPVDLDTSTKYVEELPDINASFQLSVTGKGQIDIEIWASTEKSGEGNDGWINRVAEKFNQKNFKLADGRTVSVSIRAIDAGAQVDYVTIKNMRPDALSPANYLWGDMIESKGVYIEMIEERLAGNTAGILMKKSVYDAYITKHGGLKLNELLDAAIADEIMLGYTNPYTSDTALNMLTQMLITLDPANPLSEQAEQKFFELQKHVPPPAYTTAQMRESAKKGFVDVMTMECQAYSNEPTLKDYVFTPFGVRHDNPVFIFESMPSDRREVLDMFIEFAKNEDNQKLATQMGFNNNEDYKGAESLSGADLYNAQALWKKNKSGGKPAVAVFVADASGSMSDNGGLASLKESLLNSMKYIGEDNEIGFVSFSEDFCVELPIGKFQGAHRGKFQSAVKNLEVRGGTHIYSGILVAIDLIRQHKETYGDANYMIIVLSDGANTGGVNEDIVAQLIVSYGVTVHTIGYSNEADMDALKRLSSYTEGSCDQVTEDNVIYKLKNLFNSQM